MKGAILAKGERWYTCMAKVFDAVNGAQRNYNWLITDYENFPLPEEKCGMKQKEPYCWMTGDELSDFVSQHETYQWVWAVLSGFEKSVGLEEVLNYDLPYADGYPGFWKNPITIQHPLAEVELVAWDSACTMIISKNEKMVEDFRNAFLFSQTLEEYNSPKGDSEYARWWLQNH